MGVSSSNAMSPGNPAISGDENNEKMARAGPPLGGELLLQMFLRRGVLMKRRAAIEPVIGPIKQDNRMSPTISPTPLAMPSTSCSPLPVITSGASSAG
jgi:hypothetical protein